jgi:transcriptional regulator with XRE-family HTH domain
MTPASELRRLSMSEARRLPAGSRIRWARARKRLSHDQLAERVGSSRSYLIRVEKGIHMPSLELRARIAVATEQPADFFSDGADEDDEESDLMRALVIALRQVIAYETVRVEREPARD